MEKLSEIFDRKNGYSRMKDLRAAGIQTRTIAKAVDDGIIEKIKPGLYKLLDFPWDENSSFADVCTANKNAVICLLSAASYYELTTYNPAEVFTAVPNNTAKFHLHHPPVRVFYFSDRYYRYEMETLVTKSGIVRIYKKEKTICDLFRFMKKIGEDIVIESLKEYLNNKAGRSIPKLFENAEFCGVKNIIEPMVKAFLS